VEAIPLKLLEMGCLPGNIVELIQIAPFWRSAISEHQWRACGHSSGNSGGDWGRNYSKL